MLNSLKRIWAVALLTSTEGLRQPSFFILFAISAMLIAFAPAFAFFHLNEEVKMVTDLGLSTIMTVSTLLAVLTASVTVTDEIEGKTALTMLSKPLSREEFLLGKYLGIVITSCAMVLLSTVVLLFTLRFTKYDAQLDPLFMKCMMYGLAIELSVFSFFFVRWMLFGGHTALVPAFWWAFAAGTLFTVVSLEFWTPTAAIWEWRILYGMICTWLHVLVISAAAVALATRFTLVQSAIGASVFFLVGHGSGAIVTHFRDGENLTATGTVLRTILPDLDQFNITDALATAFIDKPIHIPADLILESSLYAVLYVTVLLAGASALFAKRELA